MSTQKITDPSEKTAAALGALMFFIPHFMNKKTDFVTFYMKQSFGLWIIFLILGILLKIIAMIAFANAPTAATFATTTHSSGLLAILKIFTMVISLASFAVFILILFLVYKAYKGEKYEIPYVLQYVNILLSKISGLQNFFSSKN